MWQDTVTPGRESVSGQSPWLIRGGVEGLRIVPQSLAPKFLEEPFQSGLSGRIPDYDLTS